MPLARLPLPRLMLLAELMPLARLASLADLLCLPLPLVCPALGDDRDHPGQGGWSRSPEAAQ